MTVMDLPEVTLAPFTPLCDNVESVELTGGLPEGGIYSEMEWKMDSFILRI
jgi:hypothetical protein